MILLDTHVLVWVDSGRGPLGAQSAQLIEQAWTDQQLGVSAVTFWECAQLHRRGRIRLPLEPQAWRGELLDDGLVELPVDGGTAILAAELTLEHKDPADRFIAATAIVQEATLVTSDRVLLGWRSHLRLQDAGK